jgi:hypothetical protein
MPKFTILRIGYRQLEIEADTLADALAEAPSRSFGSEFDYDYVDDGTLPNDLMAVNVYKTITSGVSYYKQTKAVGSLQRVKQTGMMSCGSGDDHTLSHDEWDLVKSHDPADGDLTLPAGPLATRRQRRGS